MKPLLMNRKTLLIAAIIALAIILLGALMKINHWNGIALLNGNTMLALGMILHTILFFIVLHDIIINPIRNKFMWLIGMFFFSSITMIFYLINREKHMERDFNPNFNSHQDT